MYATFPLTGDLKTEFQCVKLNYTSIVGVGPWIRLLHVCLMID